MFTRVKGNDAVRPTRLLLTAAVWMICFGTASRLVAEPATLALTLTRPDDAATGDLGEKMLSLVELRLGADKSLAIVERRQIDAVTQEHVLDRSRPRNPQLQLGKLLTADVLAMLEFAAPSRGKMAASRGDVCALSIRRRRPFAAWPPPRSTRRHWKRPPSIWPTTSRP